jgi:hypothetical protein
MSIAAGGRMKQVVKKDKCLSRWIGTHTTVFNVQILNSAVYRSVTGTPAPSCPFSVDIHKQHGFPSYNIPEESTGISGGFGTLKSISEIDGVKEEEIEPAVVQMLEKRDYIGNLFPRILLLMAYIFHWVTSSLRKSISQIRMDPFVNSVPLPIWRPS